MNKLNLLTDPILTDTWNSWRYKTGDIGYSMCNDYLFRVMMQTDPSILALLLSSLLKTEVQEKDIQIRNPIEVGKGLMEKEYVLDTKISLHDSITVNVELQLWPQKFWKERALSYLSRIFDSLQKGDTYIDVRQSIHIGILSFSLSDLDLTPEFYAEYLFKNRKNNEIFSDRMLLRVLCLEHTDLATEEDRNYGLLMWARYFSASTWEELKALAEEYPVMEKTISKAWGLSEDQQIRELMMLREEGIRVRRTEEALYKQGREELAQAKAEVEKSHAEVEKSHAEVRKIGAEKDKMAAKIDTISAEKDKMAEKIDTISAEKDKMAAEIDRLTEMLREHGIDPDKV